MTSVLSPQFYITREDGNMVPLIAVDELPVHVNIRGVNRHLDPHEAQGMIHIAQVDTRGGCYGVEGPSPPVLNGQQRFNSEYSNSALKSAFSLAGDSQHAAADQHDFSNSTTKANSRAVMLQSIWDQTLSNQSSINPPSGKPTPPSSPFYAMVKKPSKPPGSPMAWTAALPSSPATSQAMTPYNAASTATALAAINRTSVPYTGKKEYCSYWLRHGECDYQQQGCLYKHEMPTDMATLSRLGLREIPRWYREVHGLPSISNFSTSNSGISVIGSGLRQSRWAPGNGSVINTFRSGPGERSRIARDNWRFSPVFPSTSAAPRAAQSQRLPSSSEEPTKQFSFPEPPPLSPPESPTTKPAPSAVSNVKNAQTHSPPAKIPPLKCGTRLSSALRGRTSLTSQTPPPPPPPQNQTQTSKVPTKTGGHKESQKESKSKRGKRAQKADRETTGATGTKGASSSSVAIDPLPSFPALAPAKRVFEGDSGKDTSSSSYSSVGVETDVDVDEENGEILV